MRCTCGRRYLVSGGGKKNYRERFITFSMWIYTVSSLGGSRPAIPSSWALLYGASPRHSVIQSSLGSVENHAHRDFPRFPRYLWITQHITRSSRSSGPLQMTACATFLYGANTVT